MKANLSSTMSPKFASLFPNDNMYSQNSLRPLPQGGGKMRATPNSLYNNSPIRNPASMFGGKNKLKFSSVGIPSKKGFGQGVGVIRPSTTGHTMRMSASMSSPSKFGNGGFEEEKKVDCSSSFHKAQHLLDTAKQQQEARRHGGAVGGGGGAGGSLLGSGGVLRRTSDPKLQTTFGGGGSDTDNSSVGGGRGVRDGGSVGDSESPQQQQRNNPQQQQVPPPHPSMAFARPATSHEGMIRGGGSIDNENLREEVKRLQMAMVDQFRGKGR